nr:hypothetical protein [candidate division Zixibacteria bacterium]
MNITSESRHKDHHGHVTGGIILIGLGIIFLMINFDIMPGIEKSWPVIIIIVGLALILKGFFENRKSE